MATGRPPGPDPSLVFGFLTSYFASRQPKGKPHRWAFLLALVGAVCFLVLLVLLLLFKYNPFQ